MCARGVKVSESGAATFIVVFFQPQLEAAGQNICSVSLVVPPLFLLVVFNCVFIKKEQ